MSLFSSSVPDARDPKKDHTRCLRVGDHGIDRLADVLAQSLPGLLVLNSHGRPPRASVTPATAFYYTARAVTQA